MHQHLRAQYFTKLGKQPGLLELAVYNKSWRKCLEPKVFIENTRVLIVAIFFVVTSYRKDTYKV